ncbi:MAG: mandelate racemase/muconate lactonizing enzyme family protein [bacterium]|nr:mandelate racemase/muconate lactonizing enzyme family protein [bacterium]
MSIKSIETFVAPGMCIVRVTTDTGAVGYGQTAPQLPKITALILHEQVARYFLGADAGDPDALALQAIEGEMKFPGSYICRAVGGIETALWDLHGKLHDKSVCEMLGGRPRPILAYGSSMRRDIKPRDEADRLKRFQDQYGFKSFKIRVGTPVGHDRDQWPGRSEELVRTVRGTLGDKTGIFVDGNSCYTPRRAIELGRVLEDNDVRHFEEPCPYWELEWTAEVERALKVPIAGGEQDTDLAQFRRMIKMRAVDIVQPDICYIGGIGRAYKVAMMAAEAGMPCTPHSSNLSLVTLFTVHLMGAIPNPGILEFTVESFPNTAQAAYSPVLEVRDGQTQIPGGPGWGVTINPEWMEKAEYRISTKA